MPFRDVNGATLCYETIGNGPNAVVFIHGGNGGMLSTITAGYGNADSSIAPDKAAFLGRVGFSGFRVGS